jgi:glycosyltransferase involved in cell wall biosynthesis
MQQNPYWPLLAEALARQGVHVMRDNPRILNLRWLLAHRRCIQVLHVHYFQSHYAYEWTTARLRWVLRFARNLIAARLLGYRVVWTVHNESPSFPLRPEWVEGFAHLVIARLASALIVHCECARKLVAERYGRKRGVYVASHPNFIDVYPGNATHAEAQERLALPGEATVFLFFGQLRPNKGVENLLCAFAALPGERLRLLIAGDPGPDADYVERLRALAQEDERVLFRPEWVPPEQVQLYYAAADVVAAPFTRVLTSSSVMEAMSFGKPVIAPAMGCLPEVVSPGTGWLYDPKASGALENALRHSLQSKSRDVGQRALERARELTWEEMANKTVTAYGFEGEGSVL